MKKIAPLLLLLSLLSADFAFGQVFQYPVAVGFPQIAVGGDSGGDNYVTLLQIVNNNSAATTAHLTVYSNDGSPLPVLLDEGGPQSTWDITQPAGQAGQLRITLNGPVTPGWMAISYSPSQALTTVVIQYRTGGTLRSEVGVQPAIAFGDFSTDVEDYVQSADVAAETDDGGGGSVINVGLAVANPAPAAASFLVRLWDPDAGTLLSSKALSLPAHGHVAQFLAELFPNILTIGRMRVKLSLDSCSNASCAAIGGTCCLATVLRLNGDQFTTVPVAERAQGDQIRILPQVAFGGPAAGLNMKTVLYFTTNVSTGVFGTADIFDDNGNPLPASADGAAPSSSITFTVPGNRVSRVVLSGDQTLRSGWIRLTLSGAVHLIASAVFQTFNGQNLVSEASVLESSPITQGLIYAKSESGISNVGVAFANNQSAPNTVNLKLFNGDGSVFATQAIALPANGHLARFITELFPDIGSISNFDGALLVSSSTAFSAVALRLSSDKIATLPVAIDGMYRPSITGLRVTKTVRSPLEVDFAIDITDLDSDTATVSSTGVANTAILNFGSGFVYSYAVTLDGNALIGPSTGTITGILKPTNITNVPAGTSAFFYIVIVDTAGNESNFIYTTIRFN